MKKAKLSVIVLSLLLLGAGLFPFYACNKDLHPGQCGYGPTVLKPYVQKQVAFRGTINKTINFLDKADYKERPDACVYGWAEETTSPAQMVSLLSSYGITEINNKDHLLYTTIYYSNAQTDYSLKDENIYGFLVITHDDKGYMYTQVFQKSGNHFEHLKQFDAKVWRLYFDESNDLAKILSGRQANLGYAIDIAFKESIYKEAYKGFKKDLFQHRIDKALHKVSALKGGLTTISFNTPEHTGPSVCTLAECKVTGKGRCTKAAGSGIAKCSQDNTTQDDCGAKVAYEVASLTNNTVMEATVHFRDHVLSHSNYGVHFTEDLEYVGYIFTQHLSVADALEVVSVMENVIYPLAQKLNGSNVGDDSSIFISGAQVTSLQSIITRIRTVSDDPLYTEILDEMSANVTYV